MNTEQEVKAYIAGQPEPKRSEIQTIHDLTLRIDPDCRLWFSDGKNSDGKIVTNPSIGFGSYTIRYADGSTKEFHRIGLGANKTGISVYILGLDDKTYLAETFGKTLGKATVTGYCIRFKTIREIDVDVLEAAIRYGLEASDV